MRTNVPSLLLLAFLGCGAVRVRAQAPGPQPIRAVHGMVAAREGHAARVGVEILRRGGNAVDAAVAVGLALAVTHPSAGNLGGGGFMVIRMANGSSVAIDYREVAPALARRDLYLDGAGNVIPDASTVGYRAVGVPGTVSGLALAQQKHGVLKWRDVVEPARRLAEQGFPVSFSLSASLRGDAVLGRFSESRRVFLKNGAFFAPGETLRQPDLAQTLRRLQEAGPREFYEGETARRIADDMKASGGLITLDDLKRYKAVERSVLRGTYRGYEVVTMPPPSSGGVALLEMLNLLEPQDVAGIGFNSVQSNHLLIEVMRRAFADRSAFMGDPDFVKVPVQGLTSKRYAAEVAKTIDRDKATPSARTGAGKPQAHESEQTTHYSVVDAAGNAVSNTYTLNGSYGSGVTARGTGVLLNNEMDDFTSKPGVPNQFGLIQGEANAIAPFKRPLSSMTPTILVKNNKPFLVIGSPGGPTIITTVLQVLLNVVDHGMNLREAVGAPRLHHQWLPDAINVEAYKMSKDMIEVLQGRGHVFGPKAGKAGNYWGDAQGVMIDPATGLRLGASDPRSQDGLAAGY